MRAHWQLGIGIVTATTGAGVIWLMAARFRDVLEPFGAELPLVSIAFLNYTQFVLLMPILVIAVRLFWPQPKQRALLSLIAGLALFLLSPVFVFFAGYWPIFEIAGSL
jgi:hypothetical protein